MALTTGSRLGPYEIVSRLGAGGMGEVYRARDTRLKRKVAIKVLPAAFAQDPDRLARFQREAELLATLNHSHIAAVYGLEQTADTSAIVMELVEGETLAERLGGSQDRPLHESQAAVSGLKPANVKVTPDGVVKVLDFGLAKAVGPAEAGRHASATPPTPSGVRLQADLAATKALTGAHVILGTAAYMAPEQAKGRAVDKRADIWAFGCVLYAMLTGRRAFDGEDISDTLAFVLTKEPAWDALPPDTPPVITRLLRRCLEKDQKRRLRDIGEARLAIDEYRAEPEPPDRARAIAPRRAWLPWAAAATFGLLALAISDCRLQIELLIADWQA